MLRGVMVASVLLILSIQAQAQLSAPAQERGDSQFKLVHRSLSSSLNPLANGGSFVDPTKSLLKLQRQTDIQFLPVGFIPKVETETDSSKLKALRYAVAYYRDSEAVGIAGLVDVMVGLRFDTRN